MAAHQAPPSLGFSRQEHWSGLPFPSPMHESEKWKGSHSVMSDPQRPHGLQPSRLLHPWEFPGKSTGVGCHCLLHSNVLPAINFLSSMFCCHGISLRNCMCTTCNRQEPFLKSALVYGTKQLRMHAAYSVKLWVSLRNLGNHMSPVTWGWAFHIVWLQYTLDVQVNLCLVNFFSP